MSATATDEGAKFVAGPQPWGARPPIRVATSSTSPVPRMANAPVAMAASFSAMRGWAADTGSAADLRHDPAIGCVVHREPHVVVPLSVVDGGDDQDIAVARG